MFGFDGYGMGFGGFQIFQLLFFIAFFGIFLVFLINAGKGIAQWGKNNRSPRLTVNAAVVASGRTSASTTITVTARGIQRAPPPTM